MRQTFIFILLLIGLSACGFQMRGTQSITAANISRLNLHSVSAAGLSREVKSQLQLAGVAISPTADYTLALENETYQRSVLSVSPNTGKVEEYQLALTVRMSLSKTGVEDLLSYELIRISRDYLYDEDALLGKTTEENKLKQDLRRQAATRIIRRLNATTKNN